MARERSVRFTVHTSQARGEVSPLWFGHNLEHTRSCVWRGLSAEMLRNRKFAGKPEQLSGQAMGWYAIGAEDSLFLLDGAESFTRHHDPENRRRRNELQCQRIFGYKGGIRYGIGQDSLSLGGSQPYEARLALWSTEAMMVSLELLSRDRSTTYARAEFETTPGAWSHHAVELTAPATDESARLEITFDGPGELAIGATSLAPADTFHGMRVDVVGLLNEIGTPLLRWPGGNFAGDYRWKDGLIDVDQRGPLQSFMEIETLPHSSGYDTHEVGTDEFIALCRELNAEPFISINLAWDSPQDAAAWVEYCNGSSETPWGRLRTDRGHPEPFGVKYWSLGNELGYEHMEGPNDPAEYAHRGRAAAEAMRQADPTIELVASGAWWDTAWYTECLASLSDVVDHISHHWYQQNYVRDFRGPAFTEQYEALIAAPDEWLTQMAGLRRRVDEHVPEGRHIGIAFDEWNTWYAWYRTPGVTEGTYAAAMLHAFSEHADAVGMSFGCYFEPVNEGAIVVDPHGSRLTAVGQALALYRAHHGNTRVAAEPEDPGAPVLATASIDAADGNLVVTLINESPDSTCEVALDLADVEGAALLESRLLRADECLPGSVFTLTSPGATIVDGRQVRISLPPMSLAACVCRL